MKSKNFCFEEVSFKKYPKPEEWKIDAEASYLHLVMNETIDGACLETMKTYLRLT